MPWTKELDVEPDYRKTPYEVLYEVLQCALEVQESRFRQSSQPRTNASLAIADCDGFIDWMQIVANKPPTAAKLRDRRGDPGSAFSACTNSPSVDGNSMLSFHCNHFLLSDMNDSTTALSAEVTLVHQSASYWREWNKLKGLEQDSVVKLYGKGEFVGYLTRLARPGDLLVVPHRPHDTLGLVVRHLAQDPSKVRIVGQAVLYGTVHARPKAHVIDWAISQHSNPRLELHMHFNLEDYVLWRCQENVVPPPSVFRDGVESLNTMRLRTAICHPTRPLSSFGIMEKESLKQKY